MASISVAKAEPLENDSVPSRSGIRRRAGDLVPSSAPKRMKRVPTFPVGITSFEDIVSHQNVFYVDKTRYIPPLEALGRTVLLLAPRRFGKSLFLDTLASYYDVSLSDRFESLFGKLWIGNRATETANKYHILKMNFRKLSRHSPSAFGKAISNCLHTAVASFCKRYDIKFAGTTHTVLSLCELLKERGEKVRFCPSISPLSHFAWLGF